MKSYKDANNFITKQVKRSIQLEIENAVSASGQTIDSSSDVTADPSVSQLARAIGGASGYGTFMTATGAASAAISLSPIQTGMLYPTSYSIMDGFVVRFYLNTAKTSGHFINFNGLGAKTLYKDTNEASLLNNDIPAATLVEAVYFNSLNSGSGGWVLTDSCKRNLFTNKRTIIQYKVTGYNAGATSVASAWNIYPFNTIQYNDINGVLLSDNKVTLPTGRYLLKSWIYLGEDFLPHSLFAVPRISTVSGSVYTEILRGGTLRLGDEEGREVEGAYIHTEGMVTLGSLSQCVLQYYTSHSMHLGKTGASIENNVFGTLSIERMA